MGLGSLVRDWRVSRCWAIGRYGGNASAFDQPEERVLGPGDCLRCFEKRPSLRDSPRPMRDRGLQPYGISAAVLLLESRDSLKNGRLEADERRGLQQCPFSGAKQTSTTLQLQASFWPTRCRSNPHGFPRPSRENRQRTLRVVVLGYSGDHSRAKSAQ